MACAGISPRTLKLFIFHLKLDQNHNLFILQVLIKRAPSVMTHFLEVSEPQVPSLVGPF